jgi:hypothetical protein
MGYDDALAKRKPDASKARVLAPYDLASENTKLRGLVKDMGELLDVLSDCDMVCEHYHDGCIGDCYYVNARRELGIEVG